MIDWQIVQAGRTGAGVWLWRLGEIGLIQRLFNAGIRNLADVIALDDPELRRRVGGLTDRDISAIRRATTPDEFGRAPVDIRGNALR